MIRIIYKFLKLLLPIINKLNSESHIHSKVGTLEFSRSLISNTPSDFMNSKWWIQKEIQKISNFYGNLCMGIFEDADDESAVRFFKFKMTVPIWWPQFWIVFYLHEKLMKICFRIFMKSCIRRFSIFMKIGNFSKCRPRHIGYVIFNYENLPVDL